MIKTALFSIPENEHLRRNEKVAADFLCTKNLFHIFLFFGNNISENDFL